MSATSGTDSSSCITCGDVALPLTVVSATGSDAVCSGPDGATEVVAAELVGPVQPGDRLLVHAQVALARLEKEAG